MVKTMMELINELQAHQVTSATVSSEILESFILLLAPFAPHMAEELWERIGRAGSIYRAAWPKAG